MLEIQLIQRAGDKDLDGWDMVFGLLLISCKGGTMKRNKRKAARNAARKVAPGRAVANRNYKSSIFEMIFRDRRKLLELYNAMNKSHYTDPDELEIVTLENVIYVRMRNDLAFLIDMRLYLYEHQSTFNPNMPLRDFFYVAEEYRKLVDTKNIYSSSLIQIPAPRFTVFYNGIKERPEKEILYLSDAYYTQESDPALELKVTVLNINHGNNKELMENCRTLREYMLFVDCVRSHLREDGPDLTKAVSVAVDECIAKDILTDFLRENRVEAINMSKYEIDEQEWRKSELKIMREEVRKEVKEEVRKEVKEEIRSEVKEEIRQEILEELIKRNLDRGKTPEVIADETGIPLSVIEKYDV